MTGTVNAPYVMAERLRVMLALFGLYFLAACHKDPPMHEWYPSECAPVTAPVEIVSGRFITRDNVPVRLPAGSVVNNGWGAIGSTFIADPVRKALPAQLQIRWFSYAENKFYGGTFDIVQAHIDSLYDAGYESPVSGERMFFDRIVVGMAPGGALAIWLKGEQITKEAAFFRAAEVQEDWNAFSNESPRSRGDYVRAQLEQVLDPQQIAQAMQGVRDGYSRWGEAFRKPYRWTLQFVSRGRLRQILLRYYNGELLSGEASGGAILHPLPGQLDLYWSNPDGVSYGATVGFDYSEISAAFERLSAGGVLRLGLEADTLAAGVAVFLSNDTESYRFQRAQVRVFRM